jgi:hypothetical protein
MSFAATLAKGILQKKLSQKIGGEASGGLMNAIGLGDKSQAGGQSQPTQAQAPAPAMPPGMAANPIMQRKSPMLEDMDLMQGGY